MAGHAASPGGQLSGPIVLPPNESSVDEAADTEADPDADRAQDDEADVAETADDATDVDDTEGKPARKQMSVERLALIVGLVVVVLLAGLGGWLGFRAHQSHQAAQQRDVFPAVGRQGAINLTMIDYTEADTDVLRILDSATGTFYDDFSKCSQPFVHVVKQAQSKSVGTVTEAGIESETANEARCWSR
jgi:Mce-associated membrane protein